LDIGTYDGADAVEMSRLFDGAEVHCFEADPRSQRLFQKLNEGNGLILHRLAIGGIDGYCDFYESDSETRRHYAFQEEWSASSSLKKPKFHLELFSDVQFKEPIQVPCQTLDSWYKQNIAGRLIDFIWADVNGAEGDLIRGGTKTLNEHTRFLYIEFSDKEIYEGEIKKQELLDLLPNFAEIGVFNFLGNFGNVLLRNVGINE
jgi:FkbM family methyltransferase